MWAGSSILPPSEARQGGTVHVGTAAFGCPPSEAKVYLSRAPRPRPEALKSRGEKDALSRPLCNRLPTRPRQHGLHSSRQRRLQTPIRINRWRVIRHQPARVRGRPIIAMYVPPQHPQHLHQLPAMMRRMCHPAYNYPCPRPLHFKEFRVRLPPAITLRLQRRQPLPAVL
jgi:hypothetical protein